MKRSALILLAAAPLAFVLPAAVQAQSASGSVSASATVLAFLDVTHEENLAFGDILPGDAATVTPGAAAGAGQSVGRLRIQHNSDVAISAVVPAALTLAGHPDLPVSFSCGLSATPTGALAGAAAACSALPNRAGNGDGTTRTSYLQVGGSILGSDTTDRVPGTYTGTLVFTVNSVY